MCKAETLFVRFGVDNNGQFPFSEPHREYDKDFYIKNAPKEDIADGDCQGII